MPEAVCSSTLAPAGVVEVAESAVYFTTLPCKLLSRATVYTSARVGVFDCCSWASAAVAQHSAAVATKVAILFNMFSFVPLFSERCTQANQNVNVRITPRRLASSERSG